MRTDGRADITKLIVAFHSFAKAPTDSRSTVSTASYYAELTGRRFPNKRTVLHKEMLRVSEAY